jgi:hypothetical protein
MSKGLPMDHEKTGELKERKVKKIQYAEMK